MRSCSIPPLSKCSVPVSIVLLKCCILRVIKLFKSLVHKEVKLITAIEVTASFTWARRYITCSCFWVPDQSLFTTV